jgi:hypothetical protein
LPRYRSAEKFGSAGGAAGTVAATDATVLVASCAWDTEVVSVDVDVVDAASDARTSDGAAAVCSAEAGRVVPGSAVAREALCRLGGVVRHRAAPTPATTSTPALSTKATAITAADLPVRCWECRPIR